jgi:hypothetical protein
MDTTVVIPQSPAPVSMRSIVGSFGGSASLYTTGADAQSNAGYARIQSVNGSIVPEGLAIFGSHQNGALVSEAH